MISRFGTKTLGALSLLALVAGCGAADLPSSPADGLGSADLGTHAMITSTNSDGTWTADARWPDINMQNRIAASAAFTGPTGKTRKMGLCLLQLTTTACTVPSGINPATGNPYTAAEKQASVNTQCASSPSTVPAGGSRYCIAEDNAGQTYCAFRPGSQTAYCAGSPANGGVAVAPGTYTTARQIPTAYATYITDACFEGCGITDPSTSSSTVSEWGCTGASPAYCNKYYPMDPYCGGHCPNGDGIY